MSSLQFAIAAIPLAVYFMMVGGLRLRRRPLITTGWRDQLTLGIAVSGLFIVGPMRLFFPDHFAAQWHSWVWLALSILYVLSLMLVLLSSRPRFIVYGMDEAQFRDSLLAAAQQVDPRASWNGNVLTLPNSGIQLAEETSGAARVYQVVHVGVPNNIHDWVRLEKTFANEGSSAVCPPSMAGWAFVLGGCLLLVAAVTPMLSDPANALAQLKEFLDR